MGVREEAPSGGTPDCRPPTELRIALAMRGGVSLAVWIGGAMAELDLARRGMCGEAAIACLPGEEQRRARDYAELLRSLGYSGLKIDVLAGASAGGLNAVVYGFAQSVGCGVEFLREVWDQHGGLWGIFHEQWDPSSNDQAFRTQSVLSGDAKFYFRVLQQLVEHSSIKTRALVTDYVTVDLAATLQSGPPLRDRKTGMDLRPRTAHFRFRRTPGVAPGPFNDLPGVGEVLTPGNERIRALAYAARSTSSYPGAFEPAAVFSRDPRSGLRLRPDVDVAPENMSKVFSEVGTDPNVAFDVMDGGVFDNIPIGRAVQAISDAPATAPTKRILLYLDPSPPTDAEASAGRPVFGGAGGGAPRRLLRARFIRSALTAVKYKVTVESSADDLRELARLSKRHSEIDARRTSFMDSLPGAISNQAPNPDAYAEYRRARDAWRLVDLLLAPGVGFLRALVPLPIVGSALHPRDADTAAQSLISITPDSLYPFGKDATALLAATDLFIPWIRRLQSNPDGLAQGLADAKGTLYRARSAALYVQQRQDADAAKKALGPVEPTPWPEVASALWPTPVPGRASVPFANDEAFWSGLGELDDLPLGQLAGIVDSGWEALCNSVNALGDGAANPILVALSESSEELAPASAQALTMLASIRMGDLSTYAVPDFFVVGGDEPPATTHDLPKVVKQGLALTLNESVRSGSVVVRAPSEYVTARSKLAGNQVANFAGFLSSDWRRRDWAWGRVDARSAFLRALRTIDCGEPADPSADGCRQIEDRWRNGGIPDTASLDKPKPGLADIHPTERFALGTRFIQGVFRSLWPLTPRQLAEAPQEDAGQRPRRRTATWLIGALLIILRPLVVLLPLALRPPLLIGVALVLAISHHTAGAQGADESLQLLALVGVGGAAVASGWSSARAMRQWGGLEIVAGQGSEQEIVDVATGLKGDAVDRARKKIGLAVLVVAATVFVLLARFSESSVRDSLATATTFDLLLMFGAAVLLLRPGITAGAPGSWMRDPNGWIRCGAFVAIALVASAIDGFAGIEAAAAVGVVLWAVHDVWTPTLWRNAIAFLGAGSTFLLVGAHQRVEDFSVSRAGETLSQWGDPWVDLMVVPAAVLLVWGTVRFAFPKAAGPQTANMLIMVVLGLLAASVAALMIASVLGWIGHVPEALIIGSAICAATTLVVPYVDEIEAQAG